MAAYHYQFQAYHPYLTFSDPTNSLFVQIDGIPAEPGNTDNDALFRIGRDMYKRLPDLKSIEDFDKDFVNYHEAIDTFKVNLKKLASEEIIGTCLSDGTQKEIDYEEAADHFILAMVWWFVNLKHFDLNAFAEVKLELRTLFAYVALIHIDMVFVFNANQTEGAIESTIQAAFALSNVLSIEADDENQQKLKSRLAYQGAIASHKPTYKKQREVMDHYLKHVYPNNPELSNDKAAELLVEKFEDISFRTLSKYISQAKKEMKDIPPASKV